MEYIFSHWSEHNLIDRAWFVVGAWLALLLIATLIIKIVQSCRRRKGKSRRKSRNY